MLRSIYLKVLIFRQPLTVITINISFDCVTLVILSNAYSSIYSQETSLNIKKHNVINYI
jgi:hypothetical protein